MTFDLKVYFQKINVLDKGSIELIDGMITDPMLKIVNAARVSFNKESQELTDKDVKLIKYLVEHEHFSTLRHSYFSFRIKAPLCVFRQWWKYQIGCEWLENENVGSIKIPETNWNEMSGRYVEFEPEFYIPVEIRLQSKNNKQSSQGMLIENIHSDIKWLDDYSPVQAFTQACEMNYKVYKTFIDAGAAKEQARMLLPQNIYSECIWTCSLQTILYVLHQRLKEDAQFEIREYAKGLKELILPFFAEDLIGGK